MKDIIFCSIIFITRFEDVIPPIRDVINVIGHVNYWGKDFIVSQVSSTHKSIIKIYFGVSQEKSALLGY